MKNATQGADRANLDPKATGRAFLGKMTYLLLNIQHGNRSVFHSGLCITLF